VARGALRLGPYFTGRKPAGEIGAVKVAALVANPALSSTAAFGSVEEDYAAYLDTLPFAPEELGRMTRRGQERYNIFCAPCHDRVGNGKGMIVQRGYLPPPSLHTDLSRGFALRKKEVPLRAAPDGYYFEVITNGYGAMPAYRNQIPPDDRWAIIAYVRALQLSQHARLDDVGPAKKKELLEKQANGR
jgi:mono/diheme cytochrome c family protein